MDIRELFILSDKALLDVVNSIPDTTWDMVMPAEFASSGQTAAPTLREVINSHAYDDAWVPAMLAGKTMQEVGIDMYKGDLLQDNPKEQFAAIVEKAVSAAKELNDTSKTVHCSFGDYPADNYLLQISVFRGLRAYDIPKALGLEPQLPQELVQGLWDTLQPYAEEWRSYGVFGPEVAVDADAPVLAKLLGLTGRQPQ